MKFEDFEKIYALGLDEVILGERDPTDEERMLMGAIAAGPETGKETPSLWLRILGFLIGRFKG